ncbi:MAG: zf-HC2 domain-containing protein, partial [Acidobacteria bacterium]
MFDRTKSYEALLDEAAAQIAGARPDDALVDEAAARVWRNLNGPNAGVAAAEVDEIRGCDDYQALIPAYLAGRLSAARAALFEDHTRECVPCRKALVQARSGEAPRPAAGGRRR